MNACKATTIKGTPCKNTLNCHIHKNCEKYNPRIYGNVEFCSELPLANIKFVSGIKLFYKHEFQGKKFYLFGENHKSPHPCPENFNSTILMDGLLKSLVKGLPNQNFDYFYEGVNIDSPPRKEYILGLSKYYRSMPFIETTFFNCIKKPDCEYKNIRMHYANYRLPALGPDYKKAYRDKDSLSEDDINKLEKKATKMMTSAKIKKQFKDLEPKIASHIDSFFKYYFQLAPIEGKISFLMDKYAVGRMLRPFSGHSAENILYHAGKYHINVLHTLLESMGSKAIIKITSDKDCIKFNARKIF